MKYVLFTLLALTLAGCSAFGEKEDTIPLQATGGMLANGEGGDAAPPVIEIPDPTPVEVPRTKQAEVVGILREMRANGCVITKLANTDGIHYSQLVITCDDVAEPPAVD